MFELVVEARAVEGIGAEITVRGTRMPVDAVTRIGIISLPEQSGGIEVAVQVSGSAAAVSVGARVARRYLIVHVSAFGIGGD